MGVPLPDPLASVNVPRMVCETLRVVKVSIESRWCSERIRARPAGVLDENLGVI
ncbi:hypothetical protein GCM10009651_29530 [Microbacterium natoriense]